MPIKVSITGDFACWTRPELSVERVSYDVPTPSALVGVLEAVYWKPAIRWVIDRIHVLKPIKWTSVRRNEVKDGMTLRRSHTNIVDRRVMRHTMLLRDVAYVVEAHFEMTDRAGAEDTSGKHMACAHRRFTRGQHFHQPSLGCREFPAQVEYTEATPQTDPSLVGERDLGLMLHSLDHSRTPVARRWYRPIMRDGVIDVPPVSSPAVLS